MEICVCKAKPIGQRDEPIESGHVHITEKLPNYKNWNLWSSFAVGEASKIEKVLYLCLPGGIYDRLLGLMLERKASHFVVSHAERD